MWSGLKVAMGRWGLHNLICRFNTLVNDNVLNNPEGEHPLGKGLTSIQPLPSASVIPNLTLCPLSIER